LTEGNELPRPGGECDSAGQGSHQPGTYELCNVFGTPTGRRIVVAGGEAPPQIPNGWSWRRLGPPHRRVKDQAPSA
jgi:hypothetical protein